jgi:hypothetical protein
LLAPDPHQKTRNPLPIKLLEPKKPPEMQLDNSFLT